MKILKIFGKKLRYKNYSFNTIKIYTSYLEKFILYNNIEDPYQVTTKEITYFLENYEFSSISQQNQFIGSLKLFAKYILNKKEIHLSKIERPKQENKLPKIIDKDFLLGKISKIKNLKHKAIISLAYSTGMRVSEICNLKIGNVDSDRMIITIEQTKGRKDRVVPLSNNILKLLRNYYRIYKPIDYLFNGQNKPKYSYRSCSNIIKKYLGSKYHFHQLRHSNATTLLENGTDIRIIQKLLGHKNIKTTEIYTHVSNQTLNNIQLPI